MALRIPKQQVPYLQQLLDLPDEKISELLEALSSAGHKFNVYDLAADVAKRTKLPGPLLQGVLQILASLYTTKDSQSSPLASFLDEQVHPAVTGTLGGSADQADNRWAKLHAFLLKALSLDDTVGVATKTGRVMTEHERIFADARILTNVRPIFHLDLSEKPTAAVVVHMLRLTTRDVQGTETNKFFALDANDIRLLKDLIDRAIKKEGTLNRLMKQANVDIIEPGTIF